MKPSNLPQPLNPLKTVTESTEAPEPQTKTQSDRQANEASDRPQDPKKNPAQAQLDRAKDSLQQTLYRYRRQDNPELQSALEGDLNSIEILLRKLDRFVVRIAVFGMVSRGKSAVLNGLMGNAVLETGPLNGMTRVARSLEWELQDDGETDTDKRPLRVELVDTPGLDEIEGEGRAAIAWDIADSADLILFVVAGDITKVESQALRELRTAHKPLILVFNKIDLYPEAEHETIASRLKALMQLEASPEDADHAESEAKASADPSQWQPVLPVDEVVLVAAEPAPLKVREEWPDGRVTYGWESPPANVDNLKTAIRTVVEREGELLLAFNALFQARLKEKAIAQKTITHLETGAESDGWQVIQLKALWVALSPAIALDIIGGLIADAWMIWKLTKLYGLPLTTYGSKTIWQAIATSSSALILAEFLSFALVGDGPVAIAAGESFSASLGIALFQGFCAAWGSRNVSKATREYLETGCTWSSSGSDTVVRRILNEAERDTLMHRFRSQLLAQINRPAEPTPKPDDH